MSETILSEECQNHIELKRKDSYEEEYETSALWSIYQVIYQIIESSQSTYNSMRLRQINITIYLHESRSS